MERDLIVDVGPPGFGKTARLLAWVQAGRPLDRYPFWSRVIIVPSLKQAEELRKTLKTLRPDLDTYRWVFDYGEWYMARVGARDVEIAVDNVEALVRNAIGSPGSVVRVAIRGELAS